MATKTDSSQILHDGGTIKDALDKAKPIADYTALRAYAGGATQVRITSNGIAGFFYYDAADTASVDNGGTIIVASNGKRWKRSYGGVVNVKWFGAKGDWNGTTGADDTVAIQAAILATRNKSILLIESGQYRLTQTLTVYKGTKIVGEAINLSDYRSSTKNTTKLIFTPSTSAFVGILVDQTELESSYVWGVSLKDIYVEGAGAANSVGFDARSLASAKIENISIRNFDIGVYLTYGMSNTWNNVSSMQCTSASLYIAAPSNNVTTTQYFNYCSFRESPWGVVIESKATGNSFGSIFNTCLIESTTLGGINVHKSCGASFINTYMENVGGTLFRIHKDGVKGGSDYGDIQIVGGDIAGLNGGVNSTNALDIGSCLQVTLSGPSFKRCINGVVCDPVNTPFGSVYAFGVEFTSVTNFWVNEKNRVNGLYANSISGNPRVAISYAGSYVARKQDADTGMYAAVADSTNAGIKVGISTVDGAGTLTATHSAGGSSPLLFRVSASGTEYEAARAHANRYWKASSTGSYSVPNYTSGPGMFSHQFISDTNDTYTPTAAISNLNAGASATALLTTKYDSVNGWHILCVNHTNGNERFKVAATGNVTNANNSYGAISDIKLKQDIVDAGSQWGDIKLLRIRKYRLRNDLDGTPQMGLIAQEVELVSPGLIETTKDLETFEVDTIDDNGETITTAMTRETGEVTKSVKYSILYLKAVKALQEAMIRIEALESEVDKLKQM